MRRCFAFDETDTSLQLVDERGCKDDKLISDFSYDKEAGTAEATIYSMFRLPHSNRTYFQCDVAICRGECPQPECSDESATLKKEGTFTIFKHSTQGCDGLGRAMFYFKTGYVLKTQCSLLAGSK